jgi:hypothetical protein
MSKQNYLSPALQELELHIHIDRHQNIKKVRYMSIQGYYQRKGVVMLAWLALLICLISTSSIHHHEDGMHQLHACQLCALEDVTTHGATVSNHFILTVASDVFVSISMLPLITSHISHFMWDIRGSPVFS